MIPPLGYVSKPEGTEAGDGTPTNNDTMRMRARCFAKIRAVPPRARCMSGRQVSGGRTSGACSSGSSIAVNTPCRDPVPVIPVCPQSSLQSHCCIDRQADAAIWISAGRRAPSGRWGGSPLENDDEHNAAIRCKQAQRAHIASSTASGFSLFLGGGAR